MTTANYTIRIDQELRDRAFAVPEHYGLPPAQAFKLFLKQIADTQTVPLSFDHHANRIPNAVTRRALEEAIENRKNGTLGKGYSSLDEMMKDIQEWQE